MGRSRRTRRAGGQHSHRGGQRERPPAMVGGRHVEGGGPDRPTEQNGQLIGQNKGIRELGSDGPYTRRFRGRGLALTCTWPQNSYGSRMSAKISPSIGVRSEILDVDMRCPCATPPTSSLPKFAPIVSLARVTKSAVETLCCRTLAASGQASGTSEMR
eukprot:884075-Prymnesium_polylepis.2